MANAVAVGGGGESSGICCRRPYCRACLSPLQVHNGYLQAKRKFQVGAGQCFCVDVCGWAPGSAALLCPMGRSLHPHRSPPWSLSTHPPTLSLQEVLAQKHALAQDNAELQSKYNQKAMWVLLYGCLPLHVLPTCV